MSVTRQPITADNAIEQFAQEPPVGGSPEFERKGKMSSLLVETFECSETAAEPIEASEEAIAIIEELGLEGQQKLVYPNDASGRETRLPYREMTAEESFAYGLICPKKYDLSEYDRGPIPLRVLQVASHAKSTGHFDKIVVWDKAEAAEKDPVLVGVHHKNGNSWNGIDFILARWGEELETFTVLLKRAVEKKREQIVESLDAIKARVDAEKSAMLGLESDKIIEAGATAEVKIEKPYAWR